MGTPVPTFSQFNSQTTVMLDPFSLTPLLDDAEQSIPATVALARQTGGDPPDVFSTGPLPVFTASGVDPQVLRLVPWRVRNAAAEESSTAAVFAWVELCADGVSREMPSQGLNNYLGNFSSWLRGTWKNPDHVADAAQVAAAQDDLYGSLFGEGSPAARHSAAVARATAANPPRPRTADGIPAYRAARGQR